MPFDHHSNFALSTVVSANSTQLAVRSGDQGVFPPPPFNCTVWGGGNATTANATIIRVIQVSGNVFTFERTAEGSPDRVIVSGDSIANTITTKVFVDLEQDPARLLYVYRNLR